VDRILDSCMSKGEKLYLVKWHGYPNNKATWEPKENLVGAKEKLDDFNKKVDALKDVTPRELRVEPKQIQMYQDSNRNKGVRSSKRFSARPRTTYFGLQED